ncbi:uncharacterized protein [Aegilops tauschii subsp. strangulata]|uniref:Vignain n=1 Tax=Aegilops tauschii TaxID=37682 RepID=M8B2V4_AEGTA
MLQQLLLATALAFFAGTSRLEPKTHAMAIAQLSTAGAGVSQSQIDWVEACVVSSDEWVAEVDWVEAGVVSPVEAVGQWLLQPQAMHYLNTSQSILLSVQELIDCETESDRCEGGNEQDAFTYIQRNGLSSESDYPYKAERSISGCKRNKIAATSRISGYYKGGSLDYKAVSDNTDKDKHAVLIVGYGIDSNGVKYWRFKSSWGADWGEGAFGRIRRHVTMSEERWSRSNVAAAATAGHSFGFLGSYLKPHAMAIAGWSTAGVGLWYYMNLPPSEVDWVEAGVLSLRLSGIRSYRKAVAAVGPWLLQPRSKLYITIIPCSQSLYRFKSSSTVTHRVMGVMVALSKSGCMRNKIAATLTTRISGFRLVDPTEDALGIAVAKQPVVVALESSDDFRKYKGGTIDYKAGETNRLHFVMIVGYGVDPDGIKYWRFKNSWEPRWGEGGFGRIRRYVGDERGVLGIFKWQGLYPVLED